MSDKSLQQIDFCFMQASRCCSMTIYCQPRLMDPLVLSVGCTLRLLFEAAQQDALEHMSVVTILPRLLTCNTAQIHTSDAQIVPLLLSVSIAMRCEILKKTVYATSKTSDSMPIMCIGG